MVDDAFSGDEGVSLGLSAVRDALHDAGFTVRVLTGLSGTETVAPREGVRIHVRQWDHDPASGVVPYMPGSYRVKAAPSISRGIIIEADAPGVMYGLGAYAERLRIGDDPAGVSLERSPAFPLRMFSEEGHLLDIPDFGYYTDTPPYVDEGLLCGDMEELKRLVDSVALLGYNALAVLHVSYEDYIDYRYLDKEVYPEDDPHRKRSPIFCRVLGELCDYAHARYMDVYLQVYEMQFPQRLDELYGVRLDSPHMGAIIEAKTRELFERVPLDGLVVTATETHPRCGYLSRQIWRDEGRSGAGRMMTMYHEACVKAGKRAVFRMWRIAADAEGMREVVGHVPGDAMVAIKNTGGDYFLNFPTTDVIASDLPSRQPTMVLFDTYREYDGWSRLFCCMKRWGDIVRSCRDSGVQAVNGWGAWSPGCIWPDWEPGYLLDRDGEEQTKPVSWIGHWKQFRMFTRGFTPGQLNAYVLARLAWEPDTPVAAVVRDFAAMHIGRGNADAATEALMETEDAFAELYPGIRTSVTHPCHMKWTMIFRPKDDQLEKAYINYTLDMLLASNERGIRHVGAMEDAFSRTDPDYASDMERYSSFAVGIDKTALFLRTHFAWRECWWRSRAASDLSGDALKANAEALDRARGRMSEYFDAWSAYPEEAGYWHVTFRYFRPRISPDDTFPYWYPRGDLTMETELWKL